MTELFGRVAKVIAFRAKAGTPGGFIASNPGFFDALPNGIEISKLRIQAQVEKSSDKEPNTCKIKISNCNEQTRTFLQTKPLIVRLEAGYEGVLNYVFTGDMRTAYTDFSSSTPVTHLELADGDRAFRYAQIAKSYRKGTAIITAIKDAAATLGLIIDARTLASPVLQQTQFDAGRTLDGPTETELTLLLTKFGYQWSMQDGRLTILKDNETRPDQAVLISEDTGMIGSPSFVAPSKPGKPTLIKVKRKFIASLTPGARIVVRSRDIPNVTYRIEKVSHDLDTKEGPFDSTIDAQASA